MRRLLIVLLLSTTACAWGRTMRASDAMEKTAPPEEPRAREASAVALERDAKALAEAGEYPRAVVTLERALRLSPNDARLWLSLAQVRFAQGENVKARSLAARAASLAGADDELAEEARRLEASAARR